MTAAEEKTSLTRAMALKDKLVLFREQLAAAAPLIREPSDQTPQFCAHVMHRLQQAKDEAEELSKEVAGLYRHYQQKVMVERIHEMGAEVRKFSVAGIGTISLADDFHITIKSDQKEEGKVWLTENNMGDLIVETVNASSLKASMKKYIKANETYPPEDIFRVYPVEYAKITKR